MPARIGAARITQVEIAAIRAALRTSSINDVAERFRRGRDTVRRLGTLGSRWGAAA